MPSHGPRGFYFRSVLTVWSLGVGFFQRIRAKFKGYGSKKKHLIKLDAINFALNQLGEQHTSV